MKKIFVLIIFTVFCFVSQAQVSIPKIDTKSMTSSALKDFVKPPAIGDVGKTAGSIVDMLGSKLSLPASVKPQLLEAVSGFLTSKEPLTALADTNPAGYLAKFNPLQQGLFGKLKGILGADSFSKMLSLKPTGNNVAGNVLSNLFY
jgi:hypothetical protein